MPKTQLNSVSHQNSGLLPTSNVLYTEAIQSGFQIVDLADLLNTQLQIVASQASVWSKECARNLMPDVEQYIHELQDPNEWAYLLRLYIDLQCKNGLCKEALNTLELFEFKNKSRCNSLSEHRELALRAIAIAMAQARQYEDALKLAEELEDLDDYEMVLQTMVETFARERRFEDAIRVADDIESPEIRTRALQALAAEQWADCRHDEAVQTLRSVVPLALTLEDEVRNQIYRSNVIAFTSIHCLADALALAQEITESTLKVEAFCTIAVCAQRDGNATGGRAAIDEATKAVKQVVDPYNRAKALQQIGEALYHNGAIEDAKNLYRESLTCMKKIQNGYAKTTMLVEFGSHLAMIGLPEVADRIFRIAEEQIALLEGVSLKVLCLCQIIQALIDLSMSERALENVLVLKSIREELCNGDTLTENVERDLAASLGNVAAAFMKGTEEHQLSGQGYMVEAIALARKITDPRNRALALMALAEKLGRC